MTRTRWIVLAALLAFASPLPARAQVTTITAHWTAPGDDGNVGRATAYEFRYSTVAPDTGSVLTPALLAWWNAATPMTPCGPPSIAGTQEACAFSRPGGGSWPPGTIYSKMRALDEVPNASGLSNTWTVVVPTINLDTTPPNKVTDYR